MVDQCATLEVQAPPFRTQWWSGSEVGLGTYTTGATRTEMQRTPKRNAHFGASFRCLSRLKVKKTIILNFSGDSALLAGYDSRSFNFDSGGMHRVWLSVSVWGRAEHISVRLGVIPLNTWRPMMTRAAWTQISTVTLIASLGGIMKELCLGHQNG